MNTISVQVLKQGQPQAVAATVPAGTSARRAAAPGWALGVVALVLLLGYGVVLARHIHAYAGGADSSGYLNRARMLAAGLHLAPPRLIPGYRPESEWVLCPLGFRPRPGGALAPIYSAGLPLLILAARAAVGWPHAFPAVILVHAIAGVALTYLLARAFGLGVAWAAAGAALVAASPLYLFYGLEGMSDLPAMAWCALAALCAWRACARPAWAIAAGLAVAWAVLIRPNDLLMLAPVLVAWWPDARRGSPGGSCAGKGWRDFFLRLAGLAAGGAAGAAFFFRDNAATYGAGITTGYGAIGYAFGAACVGPNLVRYAHWLPLLLSPGVCLSVALPWLARRDRAAAFCGTWALVFLGFFTAYNMGDWNWWSLRFVLPAAPALVVGFLLCLRASLDRLAIAGWAAALLLAGALAEELVCGHRLRVLQSSRGETAYPNAVAWLQAHAPASSIVAAMQASGAVYYGTGLPIVRWDEITPSGFRQLAAAAAGRPIYAALFDWEDSRAFRHLPGRWQLAARLKGVEIWRLSAPGGPV